MAGTGAYGAVNNTLDDLRHTWETSWYGREVTGEVDISPSQSPDLSQAPGATADISDQYSNPGPGYDPGENDVGIEPPEQGQDMDR